MTRQPLPLRRILFTALLVTITVRAQQPPPPPVPNPAAPTIAMPFPMGLQAGTALEVTLTGTNLTDPVSLWTNIPGATVTIPTDNNNGKEATKRACKIDVPKTTPIGFYGLRLATTRGLSNLRLFCVDDLPQILEVDTNHSKTTPQLVAVPSVVVGRTDVETSDYFKIRVTAGQRLSFEVLGHRLGSGIDPKISIIDPRNGRELAYADDSPGLQTDPRLTYTFKEAGEYLIEIRDTTYRGGADFFYRLRIGDFPCATTPIPMAIKRGGKATVNFAGPQLAGVVPVELAIPANSLDPVVWVTPKTASGPLGWPVPLAVSELDEFIEQKPNDDPAKAHRLTVPCGVTGRFLEKGQNGHFVFAAKKGQRIIIDSQSLEWQSPTEVYLAIKDAKGAQVAASNPTVAPRIDFAPTADGDYILVVEHLLRTAGPSESYHLTLTPYEPGFDLTIALDRWDVSQTGTISIPVLAVRRDYPGPIEVSVTGHAGITGTLTIPAGQPAQPTLPAGQLILNVKADVPVGPQLVNVVGKATINGKPFATTATLPVPIKAALGNMAYPPRQFLPQLGLAITSKPPYTLSLKVDAGEALRGVPATVTVSAVRDAGFMEEIVLAPGTLPPNVTAALKPIPKGMNEVKVTLNPAANAALGTSAFTVIGTAKAQGRDFRVTSAPGQLILTEPFSLKVEPSPLKIVLGSKAKFQVTATRKGGYAGPIALEMRNLPPNVTAAKVTIEASKTSTEVELSAAANAAVGDKVDVNVLGTATAAGNQTVASGNVTVSVGK